MQSTQSIRLPPIGLCAIAAVARNGVIGRDNALIWHIPEDLKRFKTLTMGKPLVMGRKTWESLGRPLPGRPHFVISRQVPPVPDADANPRFFTTPDQALDAARDSARALGVDEVFIIGGGEIYRQTLPVTTRLYLTQIDRDYDGDAFFPAIDPADWLLTAEELRPGDPAYSFHTYERRPWCGLSVWPETPLSC